MPPTVKQRAHSELHSERNLLQSRNTLPQDWQIGAISNLRNIISSKCIQNGQNLAASVTLSKQRKHHGLGHNKEEKCCELCGA